MRPNLKKINHQLLLSLLLFIGTITAQAQQLATLKGSINTSGTDTIIVQLVQNSITRVFSKDEMPLAQGNFIKQWQLQEPAFLTIRKGSTLISGIIEPGEQLVFSVDSFKVIGTPAAKFEIVTAVQNFKTNLYKDKSVGLKIKIAEAKKNKYPFDYLFNFADSAMNSYLALLKSKQHLMSKQAYQLLAADIEGTFMGLRYNIPTYIYHESHQQTLATRQKELTPISINAIKNRLTFDESFALSDRYIENVYTIMFKEYQSLVMNNNSNNLMEKYRFINATLPKALKLPVLTLFLESDLSRLNQGEDLEKLIAQTIAGQENSIYSRYISSRVSELFKVGSQAPDFTLTDTQGKAVKLADFSGRVVLMDFWFKDCTPCHALFEKLKAVKAHFSNNKEVVFLNVSVDNKATWLKALEQFNIKGMHVYTQDLTTKHPIISAYKIASYPTMALIDKQGKIWVATPSENPNELINQLNAALGN